MGLIFTVLGLIPLSLGLALCWLCGSQDSLKPFPRWITVPLEVTPQAKCARLTVKVFVESIFICFKILSLVQTQNVILLDHVTKSDTFYRGWVIFKLHLGGGGGVTQVCAKLKEWVTCFQSTTFSNAPAHPPSHYTLRHNKALQTNHESVLEMSKLQACTRGNK